MMPPPPLRFLMIVVGGWVCFRGALLGTAWWSERPESGVASAASRPAFASVEPLAVSRPSAVPPTFLLQDIRSLPLKRGGAAPFSFAANGTSVYHYSPESWPLVAAPEVASIAAPAPAHPIALSAPAPEEARWSASAWLFVREAGMAPGLAPGGTLGGSQAGGRISYRLNAGAARPLALSLRAYVPLGAPAAAEVAVGIDWKPVAGLPVHMLVERRQAVGDQGRSGFSATAYGGVSDARAGPFRIDAYGQAGVVGARSGDLFADGSAKFSIPVGRMKLGAGAWGAAQPGVSRLDVGPQASVRLPANLTLAADWRFRAAGNAAPASGPTLTLSTDF